MRSAIIQKIGPENWAVTFLTNASVADESHSYPTFEFASEAVKYWILNGMVI